MTEKDLMRLLKDCAMDKEDICDSCIFADGECTMGLIKEVAEALEKREQGCDYCNSCQVCDAAFCPFEGELSPSVCGHFEPRWEFCHRCGRKLSEED